MLQSDLAWEIQPQMLLTLENHYFSSRAANLSGGVLSDVLLTSIHFKNQLRENLNFYGDVTNLLSSTYQWVPGTVEPGLALHLGLQIQLNPY